MKYSSSLKHNQQIILIFRLFKDEKNPAKICRSWTIQIVTGAFSILLQACTISACGNFAVLGTAGGWIERFNLQSGITRGSYLDTSKKGAHDGEVVGVACDSTNTLMISAGYNGDVKVYSFPDNFSTRTSKTNM